MSAFQYEPPSHHQQPPIGTPPPVPPLPPTRVSAKALVALALALLSFGFWILTAIPAIVLAAIARREIKSNPRLTGNDIATASLVLGCVSLVVAPLFILIFLPLFLVDPGTTPVGYDADRLVHLHLEGNLGELPQNDPLAVFSEAPTSIRSVLSKLEKARTDEAVKGVIITLDRLATGQAHGEELYRAFQALDASDKKVYVHMEEAFLTTNTYALIAGASQINAAPTSFINLTGVYTEGLFLKEGLDKLGVQADIVHIGDYKSAGEIATRSEPSPEAEEAMNWLLDGLYESSVERIATARGKAPDEVRLLIDGGPYSAEEALDRGLVDSLHHLDAFLESIKAEYPSDIYIDNHYYEPIPPDINFNSPLAPIELLFAEPTMPPTNEVGESVAIISVNGNIVPGYSESSARGASDGAYSGDIRKALEQAGADDTVKAVVLRVNSPGGSVTASEVILRAVQQVKEIKPVVVSMANLAASGGYYVSCDADWIFANEGTITASIGVVGGKIITSDLWDKIGVNWHPYQRGANADWVSSAQPFSDAQRRRVVDNMDDTYTVFKGHVVAGRGDKLTQPIEAMAGGRVFTGKQALELGLVDEMGGLQDAIAHAADLVNLEEYDIRPLPDAQYLDEAIIDFLFGGGDHPSDLEFNRENKAYAPRRTFSIPLQTTDPTSPIALLQRLDPQRTQTAFQLLQCAELINQEGILAITPQFFTGP